MSSPAASQILVVSRSEPLAAAAAASLRQQHAVEVRPPPEARDWLKGNHADLALLEVDLHDLARGDFTGELLEAVNTGDSSPVRNLIRCHDDVARVLQEDAVPRLGPEGEGQHPLELRRAVTRLLGPGRVGFAHYLDSNLWGHEFVVTCSEEREALIQAAQEFARETGCHSRVAERVALAADELLSNALYNAPVDPDGQRRFASTSRREEVKLSPGEEIRFRLATDGKRVAVAVEDPFGSLTPETVLHYLAKGLARGDNQIDTKPGGAGLGLYSLFHHVHHFVLHLEPGKRTEAIGLVEVTRSFKAFASQPRSVQILVSRGA